MTTTIMIERMQDLQVGHILSESSHYKVEELLGEVIRVRHMESGDDVTIGRAYIEHYTNSGDIYSTTVDVTKEDKKDGTLGIRSIWDNIHSGQVFTVCFTKQDKPKTKRQYEQEVQAAIDEFATNIDAVRASKKGVADAAKQFVTQLITNPISKVIPGEERILRGYKIQFESRDGRYNCVDMDIEKTEHEEGIRPVNINTIKWLIFGGVKYVVK